MKQMFLLQKNNFNKNVFYTDEVPKFILKNVIKDSYNKYYYYYYCYFYYCYYYYYYYYY